MTKLTQVVELDASAASRADATEPVRSALRSLRGAGPKKLVFPKGRYHFWSDRATEEYLFVSNNDPSLKALAFPLIGFDDLEIDGQGSEFIFHGFITPFAISASHDIRLRNFSIDWERTFHNEALIMDSKPAPKDGLASIDLGISKQYPYRVEHEQLRFTGYHDHEPLAPGHALSFDPVRREPSWQAHDDWAVKQWHHAVEIDPGIVRFTAKFSQPPKAGNVATFSNAGRYCPAIVLTGSQDIELSDIAIHHCGGMGVIAQLTRNIRLTRVKVTPPPGSDRVISATADATHVVNCAGQIEFDECRFENQLDDPGNFHGIYARVSRVTSPSTVEVELVHGQQVGIEITHPGDEIEFVGNKNLLTYATAKVAAFTRINKRFFEVEIEGNLPPETAKGDVIASLTWVSNVTVRNSRVGNNRARGFLISTAGKVLIENNVFRSPGAAILIAGDANYWFESGKVRDITVRGNTFDNCLYSVWGRAVIDIVPEIEPKNREGALYHQNIRIENNKFILADARVMNAHCVDGLVFKNNTIEWGSDYPLGPGKEAFHVEACANVEIEGDTLPPRD
ncbi:MAG: right-handed parallel beta-helix repeat-containing protein [Capsulimonadaceae bacterium]|nr:right-handed parallel beta-helix repeat-containing protein [Capsulimonadaceae bacterium]